MNVHMDRMARPQWNALPPDVTAAFEERIPDGCHLSILSAFFSGRDYHARLFRGHELLAESRLLGFVEDAAEEALNQYERSVEPEPDWEEDEEGFVVAPLSYENREGDPAWNGAFDRW